MTRPGRRLPEAGEQLATLGWTLQALQVLDPGAFLLALVSPSTLSHPALAESLARSSPGSLLPMVESARMGRRKRELEEGVSRARLLGLRIAVTGHRLRSAAGFDTLVVSPGTAACDLDPGGLPLFVTDVTSQEQLEWARTRGACLLEGSAVADPIKVAPVALSRLRR